VTGKKYTSHKIREEIKKLQVEPPKVLESSNIEHTSPAVSGLSQK
jgi:hypothetical protein